MGKENFIQRGSLLRNILLGIVIAGVIVALVLIGKCLFGTQSSNVSINDDNEMQIILPDEESGSYVFDDAEGSESGNRIQNPSFEEGLWSDEVGDCHNYDDNPIIGMEHSDNASDGTKSLELQAERHIACTKQQEINVDGGGVFILTFDHQSDNAQNAGYSIAFNDKDKATTSEKVAIENDEWQSFEKEIVVPGDATQASLFVYGYPTDKEENIITRYDHFSLVKMSDIRDQYYYMDEFDFEVKNPSEMTFGSADNGTTLIHINSATTPFYVVSNAEYNDGWKLHLDSVDDSVPDDRHFEIDGYKNGWYVDPVELCQLENEELESGKTKAGCTAKEDGSYDLNMVMEYVEDEDGNNSCLWMNISFLLILLMYIEWDVLTRRKRG